MVGMVYLQSRKIMHDISKNLKLIIFPIFSIKRNVFASKESVWFSLLFLSHSLYHSLSSRSLVLCPPTHTHTTRMKTNGTVSNNKLMLNG